MIRRYAIDDPELREVLDALPSGVVAVAARRGAEVEVLVASSFTAGISNDPPLVLFAAQHGSRTWPRLAPAPVLGLSVLGSANSGAVRSLASRDRVRRLDGVATWEARSGAVYLEGAPTWLECRLEQQHRAGDHDIVVLRVEGVMHDPDGSPLIRHRRVIAPLPG